MANETYPFTAFNFEVQLIVPDYGALGLSSILANGEFAECDGLEMSMEPKTLREGGNNTNQVHLVGRVTYGTLTLRRGMTDNLDIWNWFRFAASGERLGLMAQGTVVMRDGDGTPRLRFELVDCLPVKLKAAALNARDGTVAVEEMQIAYGSFSVSPA
jgi:phage tail-like protein